MLTNNFLLILNQCFLACECNPEGSATLQCHRNNGSCVCTEGIGGEKCDRCARGYLGHDLYCTSCGECFDNWDRILDSLKGNAFDLYYLGTIQQKKTNFNLRIKITL